MNKKDAYFAGGCFWGIEDIFQKTPGVIDAVSGYMGGVTENPTYEQVYTGQTGHAETVHVHFDPAQISYEELVKLFFEVHDPTQYNRQGPDIGTQYRSAIFYVDEHQRHIAEQIIKKLQEDNLLVVTELLPMSIFYPAEEYHQNFTEKTGRGGCHLRMKRF